MSTFAINTFPGKNGKTISTVMVGTSDNPRHNLNIGASKAALMLAILADPAQRDEFVAMLELVAELDTPAPAPAPAPVVKAPAPAPVVKAPAPAPAPAPVVKASLSPAETLAAIDRSRAVVKDDRKNMRGKARAQALPRETVKPAVDERAALIAEGRALGMPTIQAYGLKMELSKLRDKVASHRKPIKAAAPAPAPAPVKPNKPTVVEAFVNTMKDGREVYTAIMSDGNYVVEISGSARKVA